MHSCNCKGPYLFPFRAKNMYFTLIGSIYVCLKFVFRNSDIKEVHFS